jgi:hypothetical protein
MGFRASSSGVALGRLLTTRLREKQAKKRKEKKAHLNYEAIVF